MFLLNSGDVYVSGFLSLLPVTKALSCPFMVMFTQQYSGKTDSNLSDLWERNICF